MKKIALLTCSFILIFTVGCGPSREQEAATMAVQTIEARATGTAVIEQAVNDALTKASPTRTPTQTLTPTQTNTLTSTATPISTHTPPFTFTPEVQQYFTEEFDGDLANWSIFREKYDHDQVNWFLLSGSRTIQPVESLHVEDGYINFDNQKMEINYAIYEPFEYEGVRIDARFENKGSNETYVNLICNYTEDVGWYEINIAPAGFWYVGFAVVKENDTISHVKFYPKGRMSGTSGKIKTGESVNEFTAICQGNKITLYINGSLETEVEVTDLWLDTGKVGVAVRSFTQMPAKIDLDWVKINPISTQGATKNPTPNMLSLEWAVTAGELNSFSGNIEIEAWELIDTKQSDNRACHIFEGQSWSSSQNQAYNCIFKSNPEITIEDAIDFMFKTEWFFPDEIPLESSLSFEGDHALYAGEAPNGHSVFDLIVLDDEFMYWASITMGTDINLWGGNKTAAESVYEKYQTVIDAFLENIVLINMERANPNGL